MRILKRINKMISWQIRILNMCEHHTKFMQVSVEIQKLLQLDMSTARRRLKLPQSLYGTSTHPTMVTHRSQLWSWMIDSHPFRSMSITHPHPIPQISLFQTLTLKLQGQGHGWGEGEGHIVQPVSNQCTSFSFHINRTNHSWDMSNRVFDLEKHIQNFKRKFDKNRVSNRIPPKSNQMLSMTREI